MATQHGPNEDWHDEQGLRFATDAEGNVFALDRYGNPAPAAFDENGNAHATGAVDHGSVDYGFGGPVADAVNYVGGVVGDFSGANDRKAAQQKAAADQAALQGLWGEERRYINDPNTFAVEGAQAPQALQQSDLETVQADPALLGAQHAALGQLQNLSRGNMTRADMARLQKEMRTAGEQERGSREAILQNMQERGMGGAGTNVAALLQAQQSGANRAADFASNIEGQIQNRALGALEAGAQQAGQMRASGFDEASRRAAAQEARTRYNTAQGNAFNQSETDYRRRAAEQQRNANVDLYGRQGSFYGAGYERAQNNAEAANQQVRNTERDVAGAGLGVIKGLFDEDKK